MGYAPESPQFQSFCDAVDSFVLDAAIQTELSPGSPQFNDSRLELALIKNDERKRSNRVPGYRKALDSFFLPKFSGLQFAVEKSDEYKNNPNKMSITASLLRGIKDDAIEKKL